MTDDQPALDGRLVQQEPIVKSVFVDHGVSFTDFHSESPLCCPARAGFLTGQHTHNHGVVVNDAGLFDPTMTIATQLQQAGYYTGLAGKYMNQYGSCGKNPANCAPTIPIGWNAWDALADPAYYDYVRWHGVNAIDGTSGTASSETYGLDPTDYSTDQIAQWAVSQIATAPASQPLFEWVAVVGPHAPVTPAPQDADTPCDVERWLPPDYDEADVSDKPAYVQSAPLLSAGKAYGLWLRRQCQTLLSVDRAFADVRQAIDARGPGELANTVFIYTGDNGMNEGEHRLLDKQAPYQTAIPFYMSWPAAWGDAPSSIGERLQNIDLAPTLCELAGCTLGPYPNGQATPDGLSFASLLDGTAQTLGRDAVLDEMPDTKTVGTHAIPPWEAVTTTAASPLAYEGCADAASGGCRWHYIEYQTGETELYDVSGGPCWTWSPGLPGDPCELQNLAGSPAYADIQAALAARLAQLATSQGQPQ